MRVLCIANGNLYLGEAVRMAKVADTTLKVELTDSLYYLSATMETKEIDQVLTSALEKGYADLTKYAVDKKRV